jgi:tetratricopeptide (TPR) repeat protein
MDEQEELMSERHRRDPIRARAIFLLAGALIAGPAAADGGRLSGKVVDGSGAPVDGLHVVFTAKEAAGISIPPAAVKKGRFAVGSFPSGAYTVQVDDPKYAILHFTLSIRGADGAAMDNINTDVAAGTLAPSFQIGESQRGDLTLVLGPGLQDVQGRSVNVAAATATSASLKRLNDIFAQGDMHRLLEEADAALAKDPDLGGAIYLRAVAQWKLGKPAEAADTMRKAIAVLPDQPGIQSVLGQVLLDLGDEQKRAGDEARAKETYAAAAAAFEAELKANPSDSVTLTNRVIALDKAGKADETVAALDALGTADPTNPKILLKKAEVLIDAGKPEEALAVLDQVPNPDVATAQAMYNAAIRLYNAGKMEPVFRSMSKAVKIAPEEALIHRLLGRVLLNRGDTAGAVRELKEFLRLAPNDPAAAEERELVKAME